MVVALEPNAIAVEPTVTVLVVIAEPTTCEEPDTTPFVAFTTPLNVPFEGSENVAPSANVSEPEIMGLCIIIFLFPYLFVINIYFLN